MDLHYQREITVGTLVLIGLVAFVGGTMWLKGESFRGIERRVDVQFADVGSLKVGNEVTISGVAVGKVRAIAFRERGKVLATVSLPPNLEIKVDARASISAGFFSADSRLVLDPGSPGEAPLPEGQPIIG